MKADTLDALIELAIDLTRNMSSSDRFQTIVDTVARAYPCDAVVLLKLHEGHLEPLALRGLSRDVIGRRFSPKEEPRFQAMLQSDGPLVFRPDDPRPDPYDGFIDGVMFERNQVHSCMGSPLRLGSQLVGALTLDSVKPGQFDGIDMRMFSGFCALTAAALQTAQLIHQLEQRVRVSYEVAQTLVVEAFRNQGGALLGTSEAMARLEREI
ncbi:MAG: GAF domain-containing protein, partial [Myxococcales bacterium]|nr:GAF domain-containing protein [Myxococcales bacterium]